MRTPLMPSARAARPLTPRANAAAHGLSRACVRGGCPVQARLPLRNGVDAATLFAMLDAIDGARLVEGWATDPKGSSRPCSPAQPMPALIDEPRRRKETPKMATTTATIAQLLGMAATAYGVLAALSVLLQARQMLARRASCEVSGRFFALYAGGYAIWLLYGLSVGNVPLTIVDAVGVLCGGLTLAVTLSLRGSLFHPTTWTSCSAIPLSEVSSEPSNTVTREELEPGDSTYRRSGGASTLQMACA